MTRIEYKVIDNDFYLQVSGHAGYAEAGSDIVCSAISALVQTLYINLESVGTDSHLLPGDVYLHGTGEKDMNAFSVILKGLYAISNQYKNFVQVEGCPFF